MNFDHSRPWPTVRYKAIFRLIYGALVIWTLFPPHDIFDYVSTGFLLAIWGFLEWVWLRHYDSWLRARATDSFFDAAHAGKVTTDCPLCREPGVELRELFDHFRLMHPDVDASEMAPDVLLRVPRPSLWTRLW